MKPSTYSLLKLVILHNMRQKFTHDLISNNFNCKKSDMGTNVIFKGVNREALKFDWLFIGNR